MNPLKAAATTAAYGWVMGVMTAVFLAVFVGWAWWAWRPANRRAMDEAAMLPLNDGGER